MRPRSLLAASDLRDHFACGGAPAQMPPYPSHSTPRNQVKINHHNASGRKDSGIVQYLNVIVLSWSESLFVIVTMYLTASRPIPSRFSRLLSRPSIFLDPHARASLLCTVRYHRHRSEAVFFKLILLFASTSVSLPWVEDNYTQALTAAKQRHVPLFVEVWAPW
jgi:hypothetical protein